MRRDTGPRDLVANFGDHADRAQLGVRDGYAIAVGACVRLVFRNLCKRLYHVFVVIFIVVIGLVLNSQNKHHALICHGVLDDFRFLTIVNRIRQGHVWQEQRLRNDQRGQQERLLFLDVRGRVALGPQRLILSFHLGYRINGYVGSVAGRLTHADLSSIPVGKKMYIADCTAGCHSIMNDCLDAATFTRNTTPWHDL